MKPIDLSSKLILPRIVPGAENDSSVPLKHPSPKPQQPPWLLPLFLPTSNWLSDLVASRSQMHFQSGLSLSLPWPRTLLFSIWKLEEPANWAPVYFPYPSHEELANTQTSSRDPQFQLSHVYTQPTGGSLNSSAGPSRPPWLALHWIFIPSFSKAPANFSYIEWFEEAWTQHPLVSLPMLVLHVHLTTRISPVILKTMLSVWVSVLCEVLHKPSSPPPLCPQPCLPSVLIPLSQPLMRCLEIPYLVIYLHIQTVSSLSTEDFFLLIYLYYCRCQAEWPACGGFSNICWMIIRKPTIPWLNYHWTAYFLQYSRMHRKSLRKPRRCGDDTLRFWKSCNKECCECTHVFDSMKRLNLQFPFG